ncbi:MAG: PilN domain-containing protein [Candidatus Glassbacteria bacterium]|nr:PilN domain-containing protein [Candidatus Glassbacteria bacterium]
MLKINLLPPEQRKKLKKVKPARKRAFAMPRLTLALKFDPWVVVPAGAAVLLVLMIAGSFFWLGYQEKKIKARRDTNRVELNRLNQVVLKVNRLQQQTDQLKDRMNIILKVDRNRFLWPRVLDEINGALPQYTWLESVSETSPFPRLVLRLEGTAMSNLSVSRFMRNLEFASLLTNVRLVSSVERRQGSYDTQYFTIECACALNEAPDSTAGATAAR